MEYNCSKPEHVVKLTTGYMNLIPQLLDIVTTSKAKVDLLTASPMVQAIYN